MFFSFKKDEELQEAVKMKLHPILIKKVNLH